MLLRIAALSLGLVMLAGCARKMAAPTVAPASQEFSTDPIKLDVSNHNWLDVVIYVVHGGQRTRLLTVTAAGAATVVIPEHMLQNQGQIRLLAHAVGNPQTFLSETITAKRGMTIDWTLETDLRRSSVAVW